jgi:hypothetical protein
VSKLTVKKAALVVLLVILVWVWGKNLALLWPDEDYSASLVISQNESASDTTLQSNLVEAGQLSFRPIKINPFYRSVSKKGSHGLKQPRAKSALVPASQSAVLGGVVCQGDSSQALLLLPDQNPRLMGLGDTLVDWRLKDIQERYVVFAHEDHRDTLWFDALPVRR